LFGGALTGLRRVLLGNGSQRFRAGLTFGDAPLALRPAVAFAFAKDMARVQDTENLGQGGLVVRGGRKRLPAKRQVRRERPEARRS
jgi:hypothetical protein